VSDERPVWRIAAYLVEKHGEDAADVAKRIAARRPRTTTTLRPIVWKHVAEATSELLRTERAEDEQLH
jgi:hypothetical protein